ncbi:prefoldin subunit 6 [Anaeramoeba ignava]|uniref:Prefoldin subunit 6 n=1 Tax=Anaeramoeba ignava TaxID=1746090 RepID=A0A9Q0LKE4_ANAIG|nr:prefoldin subunit 6 [Anaeramoeba ignava]|eukprot:Anaeramoba_ignava/a615628_27.p1 GENE.a615628_27~~a615628_27.p1  ORF type:complete len:107 (-),score=49.12 a615628_27:94-414(-)
MEQSLEEFRDLQKKINKYAQNQFEFETKINETKLVQDELKLLDDDSKIFKLIGPVLVEQSLEESQTNISKRLEFLTKEMDNLTNLIKETEQKMQDIQKKIYDSKKK